MVGLDKVRDFLIDDDFINYVLVPDDVSEAKWNAYFNKYPAERTAAEEAKTVLLDEGEESLCMPDNEAEELKERILQTISSL